MDGRQRRGPDDEPAVTFELEGARAPKRSGRLGAVGGAAATGAGMISGGGVPDVADSLDVFDQLPVETGESPAPIETPSVSYGQIEEGGAITEDFPPLDFRVSSTPEPEPVDETLHGATGAVGGGFALEGTGAQQDVFGALPPEAEAVDLDLGGLVDAGIEDDDSPDEDELDDIS